MNAYEWKQEQRRERLERRAEALSAEGTRRLDNAHASIAGIPPGQPILVGHHSEKRHRAALTRHDNGMRAGFARLKEAEETSRRAAAVGTGGISSDDPEAVDKLRLKLAELEGRQVKMKAANVHWRKHGTMVGFPGLSDEAAARLDAEIPQRHSWARQPYEGWALTNLGARVRDVRRRIADLEKRAALVAASPEPVTSTTAASGAVITTDLEGNRACISFPRRLTKPEYQHVRSRGFVWAPTRRAYVRKLNSGAVCAAEALAQWFSPEAIP